MTINTIANPSVTTTNSARRKAFSEIWAAVFMLEDDLNEDGMLSNKYKALIATIRLNLKKAEEQK